MTVSNSRLAYFKQRYATDEYREKNRERMRAERKRDPLRWHGSSRPGAISLAATDPYSHYSQLKNESICRVQANHHELFGMSVEQIKSRLRDVPGIQGLTMTLIGGRQAFGWNGLIAAVDPNAGDDEIEDAIRSAAQIANLGRSPAEKQMATPLPTVNLTEPKTMTAPAPGSFAASLKAMMDEARAGITQARADGQAKVKEAVGKLDEAKVATTKVAGNIAETIENEAASVMSELGQISNDL